MQERLRKTFASHAMVGEVRGVGLIAAVELVQDPQRKTPFDPALKVAQRVARLALDRGLVTRALPNGEALAFSPPLIIERGEIDEAVETLEACIATVREELIREGVHLS
jgi:L-2,4-diaminobutyrate transaminase